MFWPLQLSSEVLGVPEDSKFPLLGVRVSSSHLPQSGVVIIIMASDCDDQWCDEWQRDKCVVMHVTLQITWELCSDGEQWRDKCCNSPRYSATMVGDDVIGATLQIARELYNKGKQKKFYLFIYFLLLVWRYTWPYSLLESSRFPSPPFVHNKWCSTWHPQAHERGDKRSTIGGRKTH